MDIIEKFKFILSKVDRYKFPDLHIKTGSLPIVRLHNGNLRQINSFPYKIEKNSEDTLIIDFEPFSKDEVREIILFIIGKDNFEIFNEELSFDTSFKLDGISKYRANCYIDSNGFSISFRIIPSIIPSLEQLGLGSKIKEMCSKSQGLILVTGPTGSGKSTNLASMINYINNNFEKHIITIEDPIEFSFTPNKSVISQKELGVGFKTFTSTIKTILRQDPDVIMVGEMRDLDTIKSVLTLAETGHLVLSTLHTNDTVSTIERIVNSFPSGEQEQIRMQLSSCLLGVISQRLLPKINKKGRIVARELLLKTDATKSSIKEGNMDFLYNILETGKKHGMILMDEYLGALYKNGLISEETYKSNLRDDNLK